MGYLQMRVGGKDESLFWGLGFRAHSDVGRACLGVSHELKPGATSHVASLLSSWGKGMGISGGSLASEEMLLHGKALGQTGGNWLGVGLRRGGL